MNQSRRNFIAAGLGAPALLANPQRPASAAPDQASGSQTKLTYRTLGKTGLKVTTLGFGCMITSDPTVIERAADIGINYFDTARGYQNGNNERMVGAALKSRRKQLYISTKTHAPTKAGALEDLDTSLRELQTDYVDVWYLHALTEPGAITDELLEAQLAAKKAGKTRFMGFSTHGGQKEVLPAALARKHFEVVLTTYNFAMEPIDDVIASAADAGLGIVAMKVMAGGQRRTSNAPGRAKDILKRDGAMLAALKWAMKNSNVHTTIPSMTGMDQLDENLKAMAAPFSSADGTVLEARLHDIAPEYCRMCGQCSDQCRFGLPVADLHRYLMYSENYGEFGLGRDNFRAMPAAFRDVRCSLCPECTVQCPHGVRVAQRLTRAQEMFA